MYDLKDFSLRDMTRCGIALRKFSSESENMEEVANRIVSYLYDHLVDSQTGAKECALVRCFKTHAYERLDAELRAFADRMLGDQPQWPTMKCLTLLATAGEKPEWAARELSVGHQAIPLLSKDAIEQVPMVSALIEQLGLEAGTIVKPNPAFLLEPDQRTYNVFHVPDAVGSPNIPAQEDFVIPFGIESVLGYGGILPLGDLFAIIMFSKCRISREVAGMFKPLALSVKMALLPFEEVVFARSDPMNDIS